MQKKLVTLSTYQHAHQATLAKMELDSNGITSYLTDENFVTVDWMLGSAIGWIKLQVDEEDKANAMAILEKDPRLLNPYHPRIQGSNDSKCLACGKPMPDVVNRCPECGWSFLEAPAE